MTDPQLPADHTGANTGGGHLDDLGVDEDQQHEVDEDDLEVDEDDLEVDEDDLEVDEDQHHGRQ